MIVIIEVKSMVIIITIEINNKPFLFKIYISKYILYIKKDLIYSLLIITLFLYIGEFSSLEVQLCECLSVL